jgi:LPXTG-motif cell wall-anchored protein
MVITSQKTVKAILKAISAKRKLFFCLLVALIFTVSFSSVASQVLAQETDEGEPEYFMGILILESQQRVILDSIKKVKDLQLGNTVILHPMDQAWNLTMIEEAIQEANNLGLYTIFETYNASDHDVRISPEQFAEWKTKYPCLLGVIVQEIMGKQIDDKTWADNSTGTIKTRLQAEQAVIENITDQMQLEKYSNSGARIFLQENVVSYASANTSHCDVLVTKVFNAPNTELMIGLTRGIAKSYDIPAWGLWVDTWREWIKPPAFTANDVERALYEGWFYGAKYFFFEQGNFFGTLNRDWPNKYIILGPDGKLTEYGKVIQRFYTFLQNQKNMGYDQPDYSSSIAVMMGQSGWGGRGSDWGFWDQSDRYGDFDYRLLNLFFPGIGDNWQIGAALTGKEFTGLPFGMVDVISIYAPPSVLKQYKVIIALGWSQISDTIAENIGDYVEDGGVFFSLLTFTHGNENVDNLESPFAWTKSFDSLFGVHVATLADNGLDIKDDVLLRDVAFTQDTFWFPWNGKTYNYVDQNKNGSWFWKFKYELYPSENVSVIAWVNGIQTTHNAFIIENKKGAGYTYVVNTRNPNSLPEGVLTDVLTDFVYFLCAYYVRPMTYVPYPETEYWLCQGQADRAVYLMHDNSTSTENIAYHIRQSKAGLSADESYIIYDYINNELYGITKNPLSSLNVTLQPNKAKLFLFLENIEEPQVIHSEALLTSTPLFADQRFSVALLGIEESTNMTKIYCADLEQPRCVLGTSFNLTQNYDVANNILTVISESNVTLSWENIGDVSVVASTVSLREVSWNESRGTLSVSVDGAAGQEGSVQVQTGGAKPYYVRVDGQESSTWSYDSSMGVISASFAFTSDMAEIVFGFKPIEIDQTFVSDERVDVGSVQTVGFHLSWMSNGSDVVGATVDVNGTEYATNETGWISFNPSYDAVSKVDWNVVGVSYNGLTDYAKYVSEPFIIWDRINITDFKLIGERVQVGSSQTVWLTAEYEYDSVVFDDSKGTLFLNGEPMMWASQNSRWEHNVTSNVLGSRVYEATAVDDEVYGLTAIQSQAEKMKIQWDKIDVAKMEFETNVLGATSIQVFVIYNYTNTPVAGATVSVNGKPCNEIESGLYTCEISDWDPVQSFLAEVDYPNFEQATKTASNVHVSNTLLYLVVGLAIVLIAAFFVLRRKRRKQKTDLSSTSSNARLLSINFRKNERGSLRG